MTKTFSIEFQSVELSAEDVWPDGDGPENPTAEDVAVLLRKAGMYGLVGDWNLLAGQWLQVRVLGEPGAAEIRL